MDYCEYHKQNCEENKMITIIELRKGKIKQTKICEDCASQYFKEVQLVEGLPEDPKDVIELLTQKQDCDSCNLLNGVKPTNAQKIRILEEKIAAAVAIEDYESAATIKKQIEIIKSLN